VADSHQGDKVFQEDKDVEMGLQLESENEDMVSEQPSIKFS